MHKLVILVETIEDQNLFDEYWPQFLHQAESMPGLKRETTSHVNHLLTGRLNCALIHELHFDSQAGLEQALISPAGRQAGQTLQRLTNGKVTLLITDHNEDDMANIRKHYTPPPSDNPA